MNRATYWARLLWRPASIAGAASLLSLISTVILLRLLPISSAGVFALLFALLELMTMFGNLGQANLSARKYGGTPRGTFDWVADLLSLMVFVLPVLLGTTLVAGLLYDLQSDFLVFLFANSLLRVGLLSIAFMLGSQGNYAWSIVLVRLPRALLVVPAMLMLLETISASLMAVLVAQSTLSAVILLAAIIALKVNIPRGSMRIGLRERLDAVAFLASSGTTLLMDRGIIVIAGTILMASQLAIYEAISLIGRAFALLRGLLYQVLLPELMQRSHPNLRRLTIGVWSAGVASAVVIWVGSFPLLGTVLGGKYDAGRAIVPVFCLAGLLQIGEVLPRSYIMGRSEMRFAKKYAMTQLIVIGSLVLLMGIPMIDRTGIAGAVWTLVVAQLARTIIGYVSWRALWIVEKSHPATTAGLDKV